MNEGYRLYGILNSFQVFLEAAVMFCVPFVVNKVGAKNALIFAAFISATRIFLTGHVESIVIISVIKLMHCLEISTILVSVFKYIDNNFNARLSATVFLIGYQVAGSVGVILFSTFVGKFSDTHGPAMTFNYLGLVVLGFMIFAMLFLSRDRKSGKPEIEG